MPVHARWLWTILSNAIPDAWSFVLMPDHLHLVAPPGNAEALRRRLGCFARRFGVRFDSAYVEPATTRKIAGRQVRYGFNNPVRAGFVDDPWAWRWSTLRDLGGATFPAWTPLKRMSKRLRVRRGDDTLRGLTHSLAAAPDPLVTAPVEVASAVQLLEAVGSTLRLPTHEVLEARLGRRLVVQANSALRTPMSTGQLASEVGLAPRTIRGLRTPPHAALPAVLQTLADPRLRADSGPVSRRLAA